jgi:hypothetical protein
MPCHRFDSQVMNRKISQEGKGQQEKGPVREVSNSTPSGTAVLRKTKLQRGQAWAIKPGK